MPDVSLSGRALVAGSAQGELLHADLGLSFWGGAELHVGCAARTARSGAARRIARPTVRLAHPSFMGTTSCLTYR